MLLSHLYKEAVASEDVYIDAKSISLNNLLFSKQPINKEGNS